MSLPVLRPLDIFPLKEHGETYVCFHDPEGYMPDDLLLSVPAYIVASHLDGLSNIEAIRESFKNTFKGQSISEKEILDVIRMLEQQGALFSPTFDALQRKASDLFHQSDARPLFHIGKSYPSDALSITRYFDELFGSKPVPTHPCQNISLAIAPHIDFERGKKCYVSTYKKISTMGKPKKVLILGVAHHSPPQPFVMTRKHYETPFGCLKTDLDGVNAITSNLSWDPFQHEILHRTEHSIEFQVLLLAYLFGPETTIIPILCGSFPDSKDANHSNEVTFFLNRCAEWAASQSSVMILAGADLAHVGQRFGDDFDITASVVQEVETRDKEDLEHCLSINPEGFYHSVLKDKNARRVCGLNCIYSALKIVEGKIKKTTLINYNYAHDPSGGIVSFAGLTS